MKTKPFVKEIFYLILRVALSVGLLWFIFSRIDMEKTVEVLISADIKYIFCAGAIFFFVTSLLLLRWIIFVRALGVEVSLRTIIRYFFIGLFGNLFLPSSIGGDIIKIYGVCKETTKKERVFASVLLDRLSGFASIVLVSICSFTFGYKFIDDKSLLLPIVVLAVGSLIVAVILFNERIYSFGCKIFNKFPKVKKSLMQMHYDIVLLNEKKREGLKAIMISSFGQIIFAFCFYLIARALHQDVAIIYFLIFVPLICVASSVPSIGGLGVREAGAAYLFAKAGVSSGVAVSLSLISFLFMVTVGLLGGIIYVFTVSSGRIQLDAPDAITDIP